MYFKQRVIQNVKGNILKYLLLPALFLMIQNIEASEAKVLFKFQNKKMKLKSIIEEVETKSDYTFMFSESDVDLNTVVKINNSPSTIEQIADNISDSRNIKCKILNKQVLLTKPEKKNNSKNRISIKGKIVDSEKLPLPGVSVYCKSNSLIGTVSDADGTFNLTGVPLNSVLTFSFMGYKEISVKVSKLSLSERNNLSILMEEDNTTLDDIVVTATGSQRKASVVGAISSIQPKELETPARSLTTQLAGKVSGVTFIQSSGQPGKDGASFIIRGINSIGGDKSPLVLIDGLKRTLDDVDPNDVASFSVLKDASATAVYGLEGANGIIVIKTKSGKASAKPTVRFSYNSTVNNTTYKPDWINATEYARMKNEASVVRGKRPIYSDDEIAKFGDNDNDLYPNTDWYGKLYKGNNIAHKLNFNISGGGNVVTYYMSGGYYTEDGMFKADLQDFDANAKFNEFRFRSNLQADLTPSTTITLGFDGRYSTTTEPSQGVNKILDIMNKVNPCLYPHEYSNGSAPVEGGVKNPYSLLNKTGFQRHYKNIMNTSLSLNQKLDVLTKGLHANLTASFGKVNTYSHKYIKDYQQHTIDYQNSYMNSGYDKDGNLMTINTTPDLNDKMKFESVPAAGHRVIELQSSLNYARTFGKFETSGLILYKQREYMSDIPVDDPKGYLLINALPARNQSIAGRIAGGYDNRYFCDINFGASGSQLFTPDKRWSSFPSVGAGWMLSEEKFWEPLKDVADMFKLRASYGIVGAPGSAKRFGYMAAVSGYGGYSFGFNGAAGSGKHIGGVAESKLEQPNLTWEKNKKLDIGLEMRLFSSLKIIFDYYKNVRDEQLITLSQMPNTVGLPHAPQANKGEFKSEGFDLDIMYSKSFGKFRINYIKAVIGYNENTILEDGQHDPKVPYHSGIGLDYGRQLNYIALGLFKDQDEIDSSPVQTWSKVRPGDIKYKDVNGDGIVNADDRVWLGNIYPKWNYSLAIDLSYGNWTFATRFVGKADMYRSISGPRIPFNATGENGAVHRDAFDNHWTPASYSGDPSTEDPGAKYPRLGLGTENENNKQPSTFWLKEASYLRIADIEIGYNWMPKNKSFPFKSVYFYGRADNVHTFSKFKYWNPEQVDGFAYPLKRSFTVGLEVKFKL